VQTFLPFPDLRASCQVLDDRRLGKQRVETYQVLRALTWPRYAWKNHPAVRMWRGFVPGLVAYGLESCREWTRRGHADAVAPQLLAWSGGAPPSEYDLPPWFGLEALHLSHRSALLRKEPQWYRPRFAALGHGGEPDDLPYLWPADVWPRWPVRGGLEGLPLHEALRLLGLEEPRPGQAEAVRAVVAGRDVVLGARPGTGGSTAGLLAGLVVPGRTLWISPWAGPVAGPAPLVDPPARREVPAGAQATPIARPPTPEDLEAMAAEHEPPEFRFVHPDALPPAANLRRIGLVVVDRAHALDDDESATVADLRHALGTPPLLCLTGPADHDLRTRLNERLRLRTPVHAGGGWDPAGCWLGRLTPGTTAARLRALRGLVRRSRPALLVVGSRQRADRVVTALAEDGLRAVAWAPPPMRASRAAAAVAAWRGRKVDALVVPQGELPALGRVRPALLVGEEPGADWFALVDEVGAPAAVRLDMPDDVTSGCLRAELLRPYGEPVEVPCNRCDRCAPAREGLPD
jgi:hypothetical protein